MTSVRLSPGTFETVSASTEEAIHSGLDSAGICLSLQRMGFDVTAYSPRSGEMCGYGSLTARAVRPMRVEYGKRLQQDLKGLVGSQAGLPSPTWLSSPGFRTTRRPA